MTQLRTRRLEAKLLVWIAVEGLVLASLAGITVGHEVHWLAGVAAAALCVWGLLGWVRRGAMRRLLDSHGEQA
ncbi:hypothetical protein [Roseateles sp.]|uniref:hypothetical protein n=1 Tax=Roseateles sp. TaxID=1971397 RepID=UPI0025FBFB8A|nr:hypothetical protein [Roseateles sp.]MBV8034547.1 hypothetical protein [Roseateles sp.]